jgi:hypothetical protein
MSMILISVACACLVLLWVVLTQPIWPVCSTGSAIEVDSRRLEAHVRRLAETFFPRSADHPENLQRVADYLREEFERAGGRVFEQPFEVHGATYGNVIAHFGPDSTERIVVGAHYDTCGALPGADDNASAVAGLIELAYLLGRKPPRALVELVAFTLEEPPHFATSHMGSAVHAAALQSHRVPVRIMICLEMIGYFSDSRNSQEFPLPFLKLFYPTIGNFIAVVGKVDQMSTVRRAKKAMKCASPLPIYSMNAPTWVPGIGLSDHRNYWQAGYNAIMITDSAFYRNKNYHTAGDTPETLYYVRMA